MHIYRNLCLGQRFEKMGNEFSRSEGSPKGLTCEQLFKLEANKQFNRIDEPEPKDLEPQTLLQVMDEVCRLNDSLEQKTNRLMQIILKCPKLEPDLHKEFRRLLVGQKEDLAKRKAILPKLYSIALELETESTAVEAIAIHPSTIVKDLRALIPKAPLNDPDLMKLATSYLTQCDSNPPATVTENPNGTCTITRFHPHTQTLTRQEAISQGLIDPPIVKTKEDFKTLGHGDKCLFDSKILYYDALQQKLTSECPEGDHHKQQIESNGISRWWSELKYPDRWVEYEPADLTHGHYN